MLLSNLEEKPIVIMGPDVVTCGEKRKWEIRDVWGEKCRAGQGRAGMLRA